MSLISSFWTLEESKLDDLLNESKPFEKIIGKKPLLPFMRPKKEMVYPWYDFLQSHAQEESAYEYSGMVMTDFDLMLSEVNKSVFDISLSQSSVFSECCGGSAAIIDHESAKKITESIDAACFKESDVVKYYDEDEKPLDWRFKPSEVLQAGEHIKLWCSKVSSGKVGILVIG